MISLRDLQQRSYDAFVLGDADALAPFIAADMLDAKARIRVYQNNVRENFTHCLRTSYPVTAALVGDDCFASLANDYLRRYPSQCGSLQSFGERFAELLDAYYDTSDFAYLSHMARLEWLLEEVRSAANAPLLDLARLQQSSGEDFPQLHFKLHPAVRLLRVSRGTFDIWRAHQNPATSLGNSPSLAISDADEYLLVSRDSDGVSVRQLRKSVYLLLQRLSQDETLIDALCAALADDTTGEQDNPLVDLARLPVLCDAELRLHALHA